MTDPKELHISDLLPNHIDPHHINKHNDNKTDSCSYSQGSCSHTHQRDADIDQLMKGYQAFYQEFYGDTANPLLRELAHHGQKPKMMVIGCSDSRVDPSTIFNCMPGDLFVVRNVANLVPPCDDNPRHHATSAALEFAVKGLNVQHIILLGHSQCGGIRALLEDKMGQGDSAAKSFIAQWMKIAEPARQKVIHQFACASLEEKASRCEETALQISLQNLYSFPWIAQSVAAGHLQLHAWHFDIGSGQLRYFDQENHRFDTLFAPFPINHNDSRRKKIAPLEGHLEGHIE